jgi:hypothetical protein
MPNELRYQAKRHVISEKLANEKIKNKKFCIFSPIFFFCWKNKIEKKNQQKYAYGEKK